MWLSQVKYSSISRPRHLTELTFSNSVSNKERAIPFEDPSRWMDGWMDGWMDEWMDGSIDRSIDRSIGMFTRKLKSTSFEGFIF